MKKIFAVVLCLVFAFGLSSCGKTVSNKEDGKISIVTTVFPIYDWVREIVGENSNAEITMLVDSGTDLHSFEPSAKDIMKISSCDMFVYIGGESDDWVDATLKESTNKNLKALNLFDALGDNKKQEEIKEGMQGEEDEGEEEIEYDEHIWLSLKNAKILCGKICEMLCSIDSENADTYRSNNLAYIGKLDALDKEYETAIKSANKKTLVFGDRFPFRYMTDDYGIDYYAAFVGCSAESEASFKTVVFLAGKVDELGLSTIIKIESSDGSIAKTVRENTKSKNADILTLDSMQSITSKNISDGTTYLAICEKNLGILKEALK